MKEGKEVEIEKDIWETQARMEEMRDRMLVELQKQPTIPASNHS